MKKRRGYAFVLTVGFSIFLMTATMSLILVQQTIVQHQRRVLFREFAYRAAEYGVERSIQRINIHNGNFEGSGSDACPQVLQESLNANCKYHYTVNKGPGGEHIIISTGTIETQSGSTIAQRSIRAVIDLTMEEAQFNEWSVRDGLWN